MDSQSTLLTQGLDGSPTRNRRSSSDRPTQFFRTLTEQASPSDSTPNPDSDSTGLRGGNSDDESPLNSPLLKKHRIHLGMTPDRAMIETSTSRLNQSSNFIGVSSKPSTDLGKLTFDSSNVSSNHEVRPRSKKMEMFKVPDIPPWLRNEDNSGLINAAGKDSRTAERKRSESFCIPRFKDNQSLHRDRGNISFGSGRSRLSLPNFRTSPWPANDSLSYETSKPSWACHAAPSRHGSRAEDISSLMIPAARSSLIHESLLHQSEGSFSGCDTGSRTSEKSHFIPDNPLKAASHISHLDDTTDSRPDDSNCNAISSGVRSDRMSGKVSTPASSSSRVDRSGPAEIEGDGEITKTLLCIIWQKGMLGGCVYSTETMKLQLVQDIPESTNFQLTSQLILQTSPDVVLTGAKQDARFLEAVKNLGASLLLILPSSPRNSLTQSAMSNQTSKVAQEASNEESERTNRLQTVASNDLGYEVSRQRLRSACEGSLAKDQVDKEAFINSTVNTSYVNMVRAAGGLLRYLETSSVSLFVNHSTESEVPVLSVELYFMRNQVWLDPHTFSSLRIIYLADHPSASLGAFYSRESFSLFGLMDRCKTSLGKKKLKEWFLCPSSDMDLLSERLDCLQYFAPTRNSEVTQLIKSNLSKLRNMTRIVCRMRNAGLIYTDWLAMHRVLQSLIIITEICTQHVEELCIFTKFPEYRQSIQSAGQILFDILDVEQTKLMKSFTIKTNYDPEMDKLVQRCRDLPELLGERLTPHVREIKQIVKSAVHIHYSSQLGCLLMVDTTPRMERTGDYSVEGLKLEFLTEKNAYYSSMFTREISEECGDVKTAITDRALVLMYQLQNTLLPEMDSMLCLLDLCSQLDSLIGLSSYCAELNYVRPELTNSNEIDVTGGRHALLEAQVDNYITNDITSGGEDKPRVMIITGPNACGKSIYLKQTVLIVYLAHIGCMVPAESATIGVVDAIFTHFPITDSINSNVSTFTSDLRRMATVMSNATEKSLVVLDEFGKGTCPVNGAAFLLSILKYWLERPELCPQVMLASHFHTICRSSWIRNSPLASMKMMDTHVEDGEMTYLYELVDGTAGMSQAANVAKLLQITQDCSINKHSSRRRHQLSDLEAQRHTKQRAKMMSHAASQMMSLNLNDEHTGQQLLSFVSDEQ